MGTVFSFPRSSRRASALLLSLCRHVVNPRSPIPAVPPHSRVPAQELVDAASIHGLEALTLRYLSGSDFGPRRLALSKRSLLLASEVVAVSRILQDADVPWCSFKGPVLSQRLYDDSFIRDSRDIDLIVPRSHASQLRQALLDHGYATDWDLTSEQFDALSGHILHHNFHHQTRRVHLEVHIPADLPGLTFHSWQDVSGAGLDLVSFLGHEIPVIPPERLLVALTMHGTRHAWERLVWVMDIAATLGRYPSLNWETVRAYALSVRGWRMTLVGLSLVRRLFGAQLPADVAAAIEEDHMIRYLERLALRALFGDVRRRQITPLSFASFLGGMDSQRQRLQHFTSMAVKPAPLDIQLVSLPESLFWLYGIMRPARMLLRRTVGIDLAKDYRMIRD